jgi:hypothetical protein
MLQAQSSVSLRLKMLGEMMPAKSIPARDSVFSCAKVLQNKMFTVNYNAKQEIEHLGVSLFSSETKELINKPVCDFIERILLDLLLHEKQRMLQGKLDEFHITLTNTGFRGGAVKNLASLLNTMKDPVQFSLNHEDKNYSALWVFESGNGLEMTFPANRELIFGTNKTESDSLLSENLSVQHCADSLTTPDCFIETPLDSVHAETGFFIRQGGFFVLKQLNNNQLYCQDENGKFYPVFDYCYPEISLKNLLLISQLKSTLQLHIKHRTYSSFTPEFTVLLNDFTCFFDNEFEKHCFVERNMKTGILEATLILHDRRYNYIHMLLVNADSETLFKANGILQADLSTNIPQDNIKNMF